MLKTAFSVSKHRNCFNQLPKLSELITPWATWPVRQGFHPLMSHMNIEYHRITFVHICAIWPVCKQNALKCLPGCPDRFASWTLTSSAENRSLPTLDYHDKSENLNCMARLLWLQHSTFPDHTWPITSCTPTTSPLSWQQRWVSIALGWKRDLPRSDPDCKCLGSSSVKFTK